MLRTPKAIRRRVTACAPSKGVARLMATFGVVCGLWLLAASRWILTDTVVPWDSKNQFYAFFRFLASSIHAGVSPFWNPYHYGGHPSVADPQSLIFAPLFVLWALFDPAPSLRAFDLIVFAHLLIGGLAIGAIGWRARWPVAACVLAAALFMFGGAAAGRLQHTGMIISYGLFPPALLLLQLALERRSLAIAAGLCASLRRRSRSGATRSRCCCVSCSPPWRSREIATAARPLRYLRERAAVLATMAIVGFALMRGAVAAHHAVRGAVEPSEPHARHRAQGLALSGAPGAADGGRHLWRAGLFLGTGPGDRAGDRPIPTTRSTTCSSASCRSCCCSGSAFVGGGAFRRGRRADHGHCGCGAPLCARAATRRCSRWRSNGCRASTSSAARSTPISCWSWRSRCSAGICSPTTCVTGCRVGASSPSIAVVAGVARRCSPGRSCSRRSRATAWRRSSRCSRPRRSRSA